MIHSVDDFSGNVHNMAHDVRVDVPGVAVRITDGKVEVAVGQAELSGLSDNDRLGPVIVSRVERQLQGGGYGDPAAHPYAWGVFVLVDDRLARVTSSRGSGREWTSLDRLEVWLRAQGFRSWRVMNELDPVG